MAGQVAYHLLAQAGSARAPWAITTIVSCLPVLVLGMGTTLAHMLHADTAGSPSTTTADDDAPDSRTERPGQWSPAWSPADHDRPPRDQSRDQSASEWASALSARRAATSLRDHDNEAGPVTATAPATARTKQPRLDETLAIARGLAAAGISVSRRTLRSKGAKGSNASLGALARTVNAELAGATAAIHPDS
jgi:hypothetical protein